MGQGTVLPGFHKGKGNGLSDFVDSAKDFGANTVDKIKDFGSNAVDKERNESYRKTKDIAETAKDWLSDPIGKVTGLFNKHNTYKRVKYPRSGTWSHEQTKRHQCRVGKNKLEAFKGFLIPKMVALLVQVLLLHILDHHLFVLLIMVSGLAFMATFTQELIMLRQLERLFLLNILVWLIGFNLLLLD